MKNAQPQTCCFLRGLLGKPECLVFRSALQTRLQGKKVAELAVAPEAGNIHAKPPFLIRVELIDA